MNEIYNEEILQAAASIPNYRQLDNPIARASRRSRVCGSSLLVELEVTDGVITDMAVQAKTCLLGQAAAALAHRHIVGSGIADAYHLRDHVRAMLKQPSERSRFDRWKEMELLEPIKDYPQRHDATLLIFEAVCDALDTLDSPFNLGEPDSEQLRN